MMIIIIVIIIIIIAIIIIIIILNQNNSDSLQCSCNNINICNNHRYCWLFFFFSSFFFPFFFSSSRWNRSCSGLRSLGLKTRKSFFYPHIRDLKIYEQFFLIYLPERTVVSVFLLLLLLFSNILYDE